MAAAQLLGAAGVVLGVSVWRAPAARLRETRAAEFLLAALISLIGFAVARGAGAHLTRSLVYSLAVLVCAVTIATVKNLLAGH